MENESIQILSLSDQVVDYLYSSQVKSLFPDVDFILSCGDLPYYYLEYILDALNVPLFFVHGNHDPDVEHGESGHRKQPWGADNIHCKVVVHKGLIILGFEGSIRYSKARHQYSQSEMWINVIRMVPRLLWNKVIHGRYLDLLVTHSPPLGLGDGPDPAHVGFAAFRWLIKVFKPRYHLHGHVHVYDRNNHQPQKFGNTTILNVCSFQRLEIKGEGKYG